MKILRTGCLLLGLMLSVMGYADPSSRIKHITTEQYQSKMTPDGALKRLKDGNQRFLSDKMKNRNYIKQAKKSIQGQFPWAVVLNCMDSRSVPEILFDTGIADLFTLRVAGNVLNTDIVGSMEFATKVVGSRLILVMGHTSCGAVKGACQGVELGSLDNVLVKIQPAIFKTLEQGGKKKCSNKQFIDNVATNNARYVAKQIMERSSIIRHLVKKGKVKIVVAMHDLKTGKVTFYD